jgi:hypothetical protein
MKYQHSMMQIKSSHPNDDAFRMTQARTERERTPAQNNNKANVEQLKISKTYLSMWS